MTDLQARNSATTRPETLEAAHARIAELEEQMRRERQQRERAENNERCFRELAEHIREVIWMTDPTGDELVYVCPAYEQIWGQSCEALYQDPRQRLARVHDEDRDRVLDAFRRDATRGAFDEIYRIKRADDGETRWIRDRAFPVHDDQGDLYRLAGLALDITDRIEFNDRISKLHTSIDTHDRVSVFAALGTGLAHDLSQPLTAARNFIARARMGFTADSDSIRQTLQRADTEISRAVDIVHHLRDFARQGKPTRRQQPIGPIIDDVHQLLDPALRAGKVRYYGPSTASIEAVELPIDEVFVQQILRNVVTNAVDAFATSDEEQRSVWVEVKEAPNDEYVDIEVIDNGPGVEEDVELFEPFMTTKEEGVGLGLAVSRTLARSHGGDLILADRGRVADPDNEDARTVFVLRLPKA